MRTVFGAVLLLSLVTAACSDVQGSPAPVATDTPPSLPAPAGPEPSSAATVTPLARVPSNCSGELPPGLARGETKLQQLSLGIDVRTYLVHVPGAFDNTRPAPVVLNFHGLGGFAEQQELLSGFVSLSEQEGFLLVTPQAMGAAAAWNFGPPPGIFSGGPDDVAFVDALLDTLVSGLCVDQSRVYAAGFSNGAFFVSTLACRLPDRIAAVAPVAGVDFPEGGCPAAMPLLAFHGTADAVVPFDEGSIFRFLPYAGARANVAAWAQLGGCTPGNHPEPAGARGTLRRTTAPAGSRLAWLFSTAWATPGPAIPRSASGPFSTSTRCQPGRGIRPVFRRATPGVHCSAAPPPRSPHGAPLPPRRRPAAPVPPRRRICAAAPAGSARP